ncbi:hypothetical protein [Nonomuraea angiospora]
MHSDRPGELIARYLQQNPVPDTGPGRTTEELARHLGLGWPDVDPMPNQNPNRRRSMPRPAPTSRPLPPDPAPGKPCAWGCTPSTGWRWYRHAASWERVCRSHTGAPATLTRREYVADEAIVERQGGPR